MKKLIAATSTPLASIFGSGFLIIVPILNGAVGQYSVLAMAVVCALAYGVGHAIRFNIQNVEPLLKNDTATKTTTLMYLVFIGLATPLMHFLGDTVKDNDLIMLAGNASALLTIPLVCAAVLSQFTAAVADTMGGGGKMVEATRNHVDSRHAYLIICGGALILAFFPTLTILALPSRAVAFYYMLQCLISMSVAGSGIQKLFFGLMAAGLAFITVFAVPAG